MTQNQELILNLVNGIKVAGPTLSTFERFHHTQVGEAPWRSQNQELIISRRNRVGEEGLDIGS